MPWKDVCKRGRPAGGRVCQDDVKRGDPAGDHDAGGPSSGILQFIRDVVRGTPNPNVPAKPNGFPACSVQTYPGHAAADEEGVDVCARAGDGPASKEWEREP
jgi:hypothetical protein